MSPELETLDQLAGGDLPLTVIRTLFPDGGRFARAIMAMLEGGEVRLLDPDGAVVPPWRWREVLAASAGTAAVGTRLAIADAGGRGIG